MTIRGDGINIRGLERASANPARVWARTGPRPQYVTRGSAQVAGAQAHAGVLLVLVGRPREGQQVKEPGWITTRFAERDVLNVDRVSRGWVSSAPHYQLDRWRTGEDPQTLNQRTVRGARRLSVRDARTQHRIAPTTNHIPSRSVEQPRGLLVARDHDAAGVDDECRVPDGINADNIDSRWRIKRAHCSPSLAHFVHDINLLELTLARSARHQ